MIYSSSFEISTYLFKFLPQNIIKGNKRLYCGKYGLQIIDYIVVYFLIISMTKVAVSKKRFSSVYVTDTTCFNEYFLFHVIAGRHYWTPNGSWKCPIKSVCSSFHPSVLLSRQSLGIVSLVFSEFWHGARNSYEVVLDRARFSGKKFLLQNLGKWTKNGGKTGLFEFIERFRH